MYLNILIRNTQDTTLVNVILVVVSYSQIVGGSTGGTSIRTITTTYQAHHSLICLESHMLLDLKSHDRHVEPPPPLFL